MLVVRYLLKYAETLLLLPSSLKILAYCLKLPLKITRKYESASFGSELFLFVCELVVQGGRVCAYFI